MDSAYGNSAYGKANLASYVEQKTLSAEPLELVAMLYSKAIQELRDARQHLASGDIRLRSNAISKACDAVAELDASLNMEAGGELALRLRGLYRYCLVRLLDANRQQADEPLAEVLGLLSTLSEGWQMIAKSAAPAQSARAAAWGTSADVNDQGHSWTL